MNSVINNAAPISFVTALIVAGIIVMAHFLYFLYKQYCTIKVLSQRISDYELLLKSGWKYSRTNVFGDECWQASDENFDRPFGVAAERQRALGEIVRLNLPDPERDPRPVSFLESEL